MRLASAVLRDDAKDPCMKHQALKRALTAQVVLRLALGAACYVSFAPRVASACSSTRCSWDYVAPGKGARIPSNAPALVVSAQEGDQVILLDASGMPIPFTTAGTVLERLIVPDRPLPTSAVTLEVQRSACLDEGALAHRFEVVAASPLPTTAGTVAVEHNRGPVLAPHTAACLKETPAAWARVELRPSPELVPFLPLSRVTVTVDGNTWARGRPGVFGADDTFRQQRRVDQIFASCEEQVSMQDPGIFKQDQGIAQGKHRGELTVELPGAAPLPPVPFEFELSCAAPPAPDTGGCSFGGREPGALGGLLALFGLVGLWRKRR